MNKTFAVPVVLNKNDFFDVTYEAEGIANYWDIKSNEYDNEQDALNDIKNKLQKKFQKDADDWGEIEIETEDDLDLDDSQKLVNVEIVIKLEDCNEEDDDF